MKNHLNKKQRTLSIIALLSAAMGIAGCDTWDDKIYDEFYDKNTETGIVQCDNITKIFLQDEAGTIIKRDQADIEEKYTLAFQHNICPKGFMCKKEGDKNVCSEAKCDTEQTQCKGLCVNFKANHVKSCDDNDIKCENGYLDCNNDAADGCEASRTSDTTCGSCNLNCKGMNKKCEYHGEEASEKYTCEVDICATNRDYPDNCVVNGDNICKNIHSDDANHCGACNYICKDHTRPNATSEICVSGVCQYTCTNDYVNVGTGNTGDTINCINPMSDNKYCGAKTGEELGEDCTAKSGFFCSNGICSESCLDGTTLCKGACIDTASTHVSVCDDSSITCEDHYADIDGVVTNGCEVNLLADNNHCGSKNNQCTDGRTCINGNCSCSTGLTYCKTGDNTKACIDASSSNQFCGCDESKVGDDCNQKGQVCSSNACSTTCSGSTTLCKGSCIDKAATHVSDCNDTSITCEANYADVDGIVTNGCEVNLLTDDNHCGSKNNKCTNGRTCTNGNCSCPTNLTYCKTGNSTFACVDASSSNQYCGCSESSKGTNCTTTGEICTSSSCSTTCSGTTTLCKGSCIDKAATHVSKCDSTSITCDSNYADVDGIVTNGCEVNLMTDDNHCGSKNNKCTNGRTCVNGNCSCPTNLTYCKTGDSTFACVDASSSNQYCGCSESSKGTNCTTTGEICTSSSCSTTCSGTTTLCKGSCIDKTATHVSRCNSTSITCDSNYADVDGIVTNGCEVNLMTDDNHCGSKNNKCTNGRTCVNGNCSCPTNLTYCKTGDTTYACVDASSSNQYCGCSESSKGTNCTITGEICTSSSCSTTCSGTTTLCKGSCIDKAATHVSNCDTASITCDNNYADVDGTITNGCEVNLLTDNNHCGSRNNSCTNGTNCTGGNCLCSTGLTYCKTSDSTYACVDASSSNQYCGCSESSKGTNCTATGEICASSSCATTCSGTTTLCKGSCIDKSATHVTSCNESSITCEENYEDVDGKVTNGCEVNLLTSNDHCGSKNNQCTNGRVCTNGNCLCPAGLTYCKTGDTTFACIDADNSNQYCGCNQTSQGKNCISLGQVCSANTCVTQCPSTQVLCSGECYSISVLNLLNRISDPSEGTRCECKPGYAEPTTPMDQCNKITCNADTACTNIFTHCNTVTHECVECVDHTHCSSEKPLCNSSNRCDACPESQVWNSSNTSCEACPTGAIPNETSTACVCPSGANWNEDSTACVCPSGADWNADSSACVCNSDFTDCDLSANLKCLKKGTGWPTSGGGKWSTTTCSKCTDEGCSSGATCNRSGSSPNYAYTCN